MQFPFCCTRLRCLVVVHGEVWTRVLGQPWETLPAAPWSHMYKMKKPPPRNDEFFLSKGRSEGPVYELAIDQEDLNQDRILKSTNKSDDPVCKGISGRPIPNPDIVIGASQENIYHQLEYFPIEPDKKENPTNLQDLVDAIGTRMGDNENVVHRMSVKVHKDKPGEVSEKRFSRSRSTTGSSEQPLFVEDVNGNGYFSDASNVLTKADNPLKELIEPYMASVENHRRSHASDTTMNVERKHKHAHKKRRSKIHKKHHKNKRKRLNRLNSVELDRKVVSLEDNTVNYPIPE